MTSVWHVMSTPSAPTPTSVAADRRRWSSATGVVAGFAVASLLLIGCGGDDDDAESSTTTTLAVEPTATTTTLASTTTAATTTTTLAPIEYVTQGATVVVANASGINGAAGRLTDRLAAVGFTTAAATNSSDSVGRLPVSQIYHVAGDAEALAVAESLKAAFGGGDIEVLEASVPAPTESGELGDATVLVLMGDDIADKSLDELQGRVAPDPADETTGDTSDDTTDDTG